MNVTPSQPWLSRSKLAQEMSIDLSKPVCHYTLLGITKKATEDEIKKAYRVYVIYTISALDISDYVAVLTVAMYSKSPPASLLPVPNFPPDG